MQIDVSGFVAPQSDAAIAGASLAEDFGNFLSLLTTQLQNQDPLEPMDSTEFTNQLVAFAGIEQQIKSNDRLETLTGLGGADVFSSALGYIGLDISYTGDELYFDGTNPADISYELDGQPAGVNLFVRDSNGGIVYSQPLQANNLNGRIEWDGTLNTGGVAPAGAYTINVEATPAVEGEDVTATTVVSSRVTGVEMQGNTLTAIIKDRAVPVDKILSARQPQTTQNNNTTL